MLIDIVILPPKNIRKKIGAKMKKEAESLPNYFVVDNIKFIPHLSLWHLRISKKKVKDLARELEQLVRKQKPIKISTSRFINLKKYNGCLEFTVKNSQDLTLLRQKVFEKSYPYKIGMMPKHTSFIGPYTSKKLKEAKKYGRPLAFAPHFTMIWLKKEKDIAGAVKKMKKIKFSFLAKEIFICEVNNWWQAKKIIKKISF
jgi:2'-5' RNA ligase